MLRRSLSAALIGAIGIVAPAVATAQDTDDSGTSLYQVDLETGQTELVGTIGSDDDINGFALLREEDAAVAVTDGEGLIIFDRNDPSVVETTLTITGLADDEEIVGIDVRPATGEVWAITDASTLYTIDLETGEASAPGEAFDPALESDSLGFDFNPTVDRIRADVATGQNLRLNPETGLIGSNPDTGEPTIDGTLAYAEGDVNVGVDPVVVGAAYTNSVADAEETELYAIDSNTQSLVLQDPPNDGVLNTVAELDVVIGSDSAFDIAPTGEAFLTDDEDDDDASNTDVNTGTEATPEDVVDDDATDDDDGTEVVDDGDDVDDVADDGTDDAADGTDDGDDVADDGTEDGDDGTDSTDDGADDADDDEDVEDEAENEGDPLGGDDEDGTPES